MPHSSQSAVQIRNSRASGERCASAKGFSMIEMMVVMAVLTIIMGAVFKSVWQTQQVAASQQVKLDLTQQAREFMDQLTSDLRSTGYPNTRNMSQGATDPLYSGTCPDTSTNILTSPCDPTNGVGLIYVSDNQLWFAGDVDGTEATDASNNLVGAANVKIIKYDYQATGVNCPCLVRTEYLRGTYQDPLTDAQTASSTLDQMEIQGVQNGVAGSGDPIFTAYNPTTGTAVTLPIDFVNNANTIAAVNSIRVVLEVQASRPDSTGAYPVTRVASSIALSNCSQAWGGTRSTFSC